MDRLELVTKENFRAEDYLRANPDAVVELDSNIVLTPFGHFLKQNGVRYQYKQRKKNANEKKQLCNPNEDVDILEFIDEPMELISAILGDAYENIYSPVGFCDKEKIGLTSQFLENAETYHQKYYKPESIKPVIEKAISELHVEFHNPYIFDFGCGSGNSVFACLEIFKECKILANDYSPDMLRILNKIRGKFYPDAYVKCVAMDTQKVHLLKQKFDIFLGASILHHIIDASEVFRLAYATLKDDGCLILIEPLMSGYLVLASVFQVMVQLNDLLSDKINSEIIHSFKRLILDWTTRINAYTKMNGVIINDLDDKWLISVSETRRIAHEAGFDEVNFIRCAGEGGGRYKSQITVLLSLFGQRYEDLPEWAKEIISVFDHFDLNDEANDIVFNSIIICEKRRQN